MPLHAPIERRILASPTGTAVISQQRNEIRAARKTLNKAASHFLGQGETPKYPAGHLDLERWPYTTKERVPVNRGLRALILKEDKVCRWCRRAPATTLDHIVPLNRGGDNHPQNLVGACELCNTIKSSFLPKELGWVLRLPPRAWRWWSLEEQFTEGRGKLDTPSQTPSHGKGRKQHG